MSIAPLINHLERGGRQHEAMMSLDDEVVSSATGYTSIGGA
jgi:hypothetical protein